jgi:hypothetical protein
MSRSVKKCLLRIEKTLSGNKSGFPSHAMMKNDANDRFNAQRQGNLWKYP